MVNTSSNGSVTASHQAEMDAQLLNKLVQSQLATIQNNSERRRESVNDIDDDDDEGGDGSDGNHEAFLAECRRLGIASMTSSPPRGSGGSISSSNGGGGGGGESRRAPPRRSSDDRSLPRNNDRDLRGANKFQSMRSFKSKGMQNWAKSTSLRHLFRSSRDVDGGPGDANATATATATHGTRPSPPRRLLQSSRSLRRSLTKKDMYPSEGRIPNTLSALTFNPDVENLLYLAKNETLAALRTSNGDTREPRFQQAFQAVSELYWTFGIDNDDHVPPSPANSQVGLLDGSWKNLTRPHFSTSMGNNGSGDFMYTLGKMSFHMFRPRELPCSVQKIVCKTRSMDVGDGHDKEVLPRDIPPSLREQVAKLAENGDNATLRTYDIEVHFSIEPRQPESATKKKHPEVPDMRLPSKPIKGIMTNYGYMLPDPKNPIRFTIWFTGGSLVPVHEERKSKKKKAAETPTTAKKDLPSCDLSLHECRRKKKECALHGISKPTRSRRHLFKRMESRYARPKYGAGAHSGRTNPFLMGPSRLSKSLNPGWDEIFAPEENWKRSSLKDQAKALKARFMFGADLPEGMEEDGSISYTLHRPMGGHGVAYIDVLHLDEETRIVRVNDGTIFVQERERPTDAAAILPSFSHRFGDAVAGVVGLVKAPPSSLMAPRSPLPQDSQRRSHQERRGSWSSNGSSSSQRGRRMQEQRRPSSLSPPRYPQGGRRPSGGSSSKGMALAAQKVA